MTITHPDFGIPSVAHPLAGSTLSGSAASRRVISVGSVDWRIVVTAVIAAVWFMAGAVAAFSDGNPAQDYLLWIVPGFGLVFFGLVLLLARRAAHDPRWQRSEDPSISAPLPDEVRLATGVVSGREAMVQLLTIPICLAIGATLIGIVFAVVR